MLYKADNYQDCSGLVFMTFGIFEAIGGLGLFMLARDMLTDGLKALAGHGLRQLLSHWTRTPLHGIASGALLTALVQSSSAITITIIGFVNAGILTMPQALGVVFGASIGTTMTSWLISLTGIDMNIAAFALPLIGVGALLALFGGGDEEAAHDRFSGLGKTLAGFGLFFLGLSFLKSAFSGYEGEIALTAFGDSDIRGIAIVIAIGFLITTLTQSSSVANALIITATVQGSLSLTTAAAVMIGANLGSTSTAIFASLRATPAARRVAAGHILLHIATALTALLILPLLFIIVRQAGDMLEVGAGPAFTLALFHTVYNLLGIALLYPFITPLANRLDRLFRSADEDIAIPQHLDKTLLSTPVLALPALVKELTRMRIVVVNLSMAAFQPADYKPGRLLAMARGVKALGQSISQFALNLSIGGMPRREAEAVPAVLRIARYLEESASHIPSMGRLRRATKELPAGQSKSALLTALEHARLCADHAGLAILPSAESLEDDLASFESAYSVAKAALLQDGAQGTVEINQLDKLLNGLSTTRRATEQIVKAARTMIDLIDVTNGHDKLMTDNAEDQKQVMEDA